MNELVIYLIFSCHASHVPSCDVHSNKFYMVLNQEFYVKTSTTLTKLILRHWMDNHNAKRPWKDTLPCAYSKYII